MCSEKSRRALPRGLIVLRITKKVYAESLVRRHVLFGGYLVV
jgi:hypothetical protein